MTPDDIAKVMSENIRMRDKLLEWASQCIRCGGTGCIEVLAPPDSRLYSGVLITRTVDCPTCIDIREILA